MMHDGAMQRTALKWEKERPCRLDDREILCVFSALRKKESISEGYSHKKKGGSEEVFEKTVDEADFFWYDCRKYKQLVRKSFDGFLRETGVGV